jgi:hypothetical protein
MCDAFNACHQCLTATVFVCDWCHDGVGGGVCRNASSTPCDAPFGELLNQVVGCDAIAGTTTTSDTLPDGATTSTDSAAGDTFDSNAIGGEPSIDPGLLWGLVAGGICLFLLLVLLCIVLLVRKRRQRDEAAAPEETYLKDLDDDDYGSGAAGGVSLYDEPAEAEVAADDAPALAPKQNYGSVANLEREPEPIIYSELK